RTPSVPKKRRDTGATLALTELGRLARLVEAGLLALDGTGVPGEEALALERDAELGIGLDESARDPVTSRARLAARTAAVNSDAHVVLALEPCDAKRGGHLRAVD